MNARAPRILMLDMALDGRGGVAALVAALQAGGLFERAGVRYAGTRCEGGLSNALMRRWIRHTLERSSLVIALTEGWAGLVRGFAARRAEPGRILFAGRLEGAKDVAALLAPRFSHVHLVLTDSGDLDAWRRVGARAAASQHYSREAVCGRLAAIYNDLAETR